MEKAYQGFLARGETIGMLLASSSAIDSIAHNWDDYRPLDTWIPRIEEMLAPARDNARSSLWRC